MEGQETQQAAVATPVEGGPQAAEPQAAPTGQAQGSATAGTELDARLKSILDAEVAKVRDRLVQEYEGKGGKMARLQSELARRKKEEADRLVAASQQAQEMARQGHYDQAVPILAAQNAQLLQERMAQVTEAQMTEWVETVATDLGLELKPEEVVKEVRESGLGQEEFAEFNLVKRLAKRALAEEQERTKVAMKRISEMESSLPERVRGLLAKELAAAGYGPAEAPEPRTPRQPANEMDRLPPGRRISALLEKERQQQQG